MQIQPEAPFLLSHPLEEEKEPVDLPAARCNRSCTTICRAASQLAEGITKTGGILILPIACQESGKGDVMFIFIIRQHS